MRQDAQGLDLSATSDAARNAYDRFVAGLIGYCADLAERLGAMLAAGPEVSLFHSMQAGAMLMAFKQAMLPAIAQVSARATALEARRLGAAAVVGKPSGALSLDMAERGGTALLRAARRAVGLPMRGGLA